MLQILGNVVIKARAVSSEPTCFGEVYSSSFCIVDSRVSFSTNTLFIPPRFFLAEIPHVIFSPPSGVLNSSIFILLESTPAGRPIYFTTDGS